MNTANELKKAMLKVCSDSILDVPSNPKLIEFMSSSGVLMCGVQYTDMVPGTGPNSGKYIFLGPGNNPTIRGVVVAAGTVTNFRISGTVGTTFIQSTLSGSVGAVGSKSDIIFNKTLWVPGTTVRLRNLALFLK